jgi:hypothetical protein
MFQNIRKISLIILSSCLLYAFSPASLAATYKCYAKMENGENQILFVQTDRDFKAVTEAKHRYIPKRGEKIKVSEVYECKKTNENFTSAEANNLYANTPR